LTLAREAQNPIERLLRISSMKMGSKHLEVIGTINPGVTMIRVLTRSTGSSLARNDAPKTREMQAAQGRELAIKDFCRFPFDNRSGQ